MCVRLQIRRGVGAVLEVSNWVPEEGWMYGCSGRRLVGGRTFSGPSTLQCSYRDGLLEFGVPKVPDSRGAQADWPAGLAGAY